MLSIGNIHYNWLVAHYHRPERQLLRIYPIGAQTEWELAVELLGSNFNVTAKEAMEWLEYALRLGWGEAEKKWMKLRVEGTSVQVLPYLYGDAQLLADLTVQYGKRKPQAAFQQQLNKQELEDAEAALHLTLPYFFKELYIQNGVLGSWGPDSGFFPLTPITGHSIIGTYHGFRKHSPAKDFWVANPHYVAFLHWGTDVYSLINCQSTFGAVYAFDTNLKNADNDWADCCWLVNESLYDWVQYWLSTDTYGVALWRKMYEVKGLLA